MRSNSGEVLWLKQEEISVSRSLAVLVPCNAQQTAGQAQDAWHGGRGEALDKKCPSQLCFSGKRP